MNCLCCGKPLRTSEESDWHKTCIKRFFGTARLTLVNYPTGYILKPQVDEFEALPESEQLIMSMADFAGISTVPHALIRGNTGLAYITKRVDRRFTDGRSFLSDWLSALSWAIRICI